METLFASGNPKRPRNGKRRICFPLTSRAYYGRSQLLLRKLHDHPNVDLELMLGGAILLDKYSRHIADDIEKGGFTISASLFNVIEGGNHVAMAKTACLTALEFTNGFHSLDPDIVVICGDRFEQLAIAMAAAYLNKTIAHIEGGDVTRQHRRERASRDHQAGAHPFRHQRRRAAARAVDGRGSALRVQHRLARRRSRRAGRRRC